MSNYLIEQGMAGGDQFTVDSIKTYEASPVIDSSRHDSMVEKLCYLEQVDSVVCLSHNSRRFRLYDPKRCTVRHEVVGHRGTVVNCCFIEPLGQIATTSADMTICLWDAAHLGLRNRMSTKDVQLCLQGDANNNLFSGSIDGTLSRWDLTNMCLADARRGQHKKAINDLLMVEDVNLLASASSDGAILMWDTATMQRRKTFKGHKKGTFSLAYSMDYHCLLTAGLDQEALVWNPYVERVPIFKLKGHTHALCGVTVVPGTPQILSADVTGTFWLWDMRNFRRVQSFGGNDPQSNDLNSFCVMPGHGRVAAGGARILMYDYLDEKGGENVTDPGVTDALYNPHAGEFYTLSRQTVKAWNAGNGTLFKVLRDVTKHEITAACLSDNGRKLYIGDATGRLAAHNLFNGAKLTEFERHDADISCVAIWKGTNKLFSSSWDGTVRVHSDEGSRPPQLKAEFRNHHHRDGGGVTRLACSPELKLLASGGNDMQVVLYDLKTLKFEHALSGRFQQPIAGIDFIPNRCLLAVADQGGIVSVWYVRPHPEQWAPVFRFRNLPRLDDQLSIFAAHDTVTGAMQPIPVCALSCGKTAKPLVYTADAKGCIRCWDLSALCEHRGIVQNDLKDLFEQHKYGQLAAAAQSGHAPRLAHARSSPSPVTLAAVADRDASRSGMDAFLTGLDGDQHGDGRSSASPQVGTTIRSAVATGHGAAEHASGRAAVAAAAVAAERAEVQILYEADGHEDAVVSMYITDEPYAVITCGLDRRVRAWSGSLERVGVLLQTRDRNFRFPHDPADAWRQKLEEAHLLLRRLGPLEPRQKLPTLAANGSRSLHDTLAGLVIGGKKKAPKKKDTNALWKMAAEQVISDPDADEEDYRVLCEQMERVNHGEPMDAIADTAQSRLLKDASLKQAVQMSHRTTSLSKDEAVAATRLANALAALGGDEFGTYSAMARSIVPRNRRGSLDLPDT